jgi:hypothetical protein
LKTPLSYSVAPGDAQRPRVLSGGVLAGIVVLALGGLALVFPRTDLMTLLRGQSSLGNSDLTVAYLRNLIRTEPADQGLQLLLAEKLLAAGDLKGAREALDQAKPLAPVAADGQRAWQALDRTWWEARLRQAQMRDIDADVVEAAAALLARLQARLPAIARPAELFAAMASVQALKSGLQDIEGGGVVQTDAQIILRSLPGRLLGLPSVTMTDLARGADLALADGSFAEAATLYFAARRKTVDRIAREGLLQQGVRALLAGGQPREAWQAAQREALPLPSGDPLHWWLVDVALGAAQPVAAAALLRQVVPVNAALANLAQQLSAAQVQKAWDTFAAAGDLAAALRMADVALAKGEPSAVWLERKAQVAEWAGLAPQALAAWLSVLRQQGSQKALANVFRLSPMLFDDKALLVAWQAVARMRDLTMGEVREVVAAHERLGSVDGALGFVRQLPQSQPRANEAQRLAWLSLEAELLERAGRSALAIALLERMRPQGLGRDDAMRLAQLHLRQGQMSLAFRALQAPNPAPGMADADYWALLADTAYETGQREAALAALTPLLASDIAQPFHAERAIRLRLDLGRDDDALALAASLYPRFAQDGVVFAWMDALASQARPVGLDALMAALLPDHRRRLEKSPAFLSRRAGFLALLGRPKPAAQDYRAALALRPDDVASRIGYWWLLVDQQDLTALRAELASLDRQVQGDAAYAPVLSAAWQLLDQPRRALALLRGRARSHANDFLWLMNYADVLERVGQGSPALRVRRHAWLLAQRAAARPADAEQARQALLVQLRLASQFAGGDHKAQLWRSLGALLAAPDANPQRQQQAQEMVGAWLLAEGRFDVAQRWLWQQQAARMAVPLYQELAVALAHNDLAALARLVDAPPTADGKGLSPADRLTALRQLGRREQAANLGFELAQALPEGLSDDAQQALQDDLLATANRASVQVRTRRVGVIDRREVRTDAAVALAPRLKLTVALTLAQDRSRDPLQIAATPAHDRELRTGILAQTPWGELTAQWLVRDGLAAVQGLYLQLSHRLSRRATLQLEAARNERSDDSSAMAVAGVRDRVAGALNLQFNGQLDGQASLAANRFRTQSGAALGRSVDGAITGNWYWRRDYPDVRLQLQARRSVMHADGQPDAATSLLQPGGGTPGVGLFLGPSSTALSASLGVGLAQSDPAVYSKAWRPWGEIGLETRRSAGVQRTQGLLRWGAKGTVAGHDQLGVSFDLRPAAGAGAEGTRELRVQYEIFFDR